MKKQIYFDNAATSWPKAKGVAQAMQTYLEELGVNTGRGVYQKALEVSRTVYETRQQVSRLFNGSSSQNVIFTGNVTQALNMVLNGYLKAGDHVLTSGLEHNAVIRPLHQLKKNGLDYQIIPGLSQNTPPGQVTRNYQMDLQALQALIRPNTKAVVLTHGSNVTGQIQPLEAVGEICRQHGLKLIVDAAQTAGTHPIDIQKNHINALCFTGHKGLRGPQGIGGFVIDQKMAQETQSTIFGGTGSSSDLLEMPDFLPDCFEAGTLNLPGIYGLNAALSLLEESGFKQIQNQEKKLTDLFLQGLKELSGFEIIYDQQAEDRCALVSLYPTNADAAQIASDLDREFGIMTRVGLHCAPIAHQSIGTYPKGSLRFSFNSDNTEEEIEICLQALQMIGQRR